ncbi:hypothetical protein MG293_007314 [Ovis ammon polii]|uniref:Peptidase M41 domain-containing protein n=1 Tax=Ovis ammon polii TaxID=230172 RepID=A0AAD4UBT5_OVIAM|nr:hypothetical protein MG293_007314 [Ovis ammon polii]
MKQVGNNETVLLKQFFFQFIWSAVILKKVTTGAQDNLKKVIQRAYAQIVQFRMSKKLGQVSFDLPWPGKVLVEKPFREATAHLIAEELWRLISSTHAHTLDLLTPCREQVDKVGRRLLEKKVLE